MEDGMRDSMGDDEYDRLNYETNTGSPLTDEEWDAINKMGEVKPREEYTDGLPF